MSGTTASQVEIRWDPPKGDFGKYTLVVEEIIPNNEEVGLGMTSKQPSFIHLPQYFPVLNCLNCNMVIRAYATQRTFY